MANDATTVGRKNVRKRRERPRSAHLKGRAKATRSHVLEDHQKDNRECRIEREQA